MANNDSVPINASSTPRLAKTFVNDHLAVEVLYIQAHILGSVFGSLLLTINIPPLRTNVPLCLGEFFRPTTFHRNIQNDLIRGEYPAMSVHPAYLDSSSLV